MAPTNKAKSRSRRPIYIALILAFFTLLALQFFKGRPELTPPVTSSPDHDEEPPTSIICNPDEPVKKVAIIGAGSGGASTAYFLSRFKSPCQRLNITIYERNHYVGGRSTTVNVYDDPKVPVELGASIFVDVNHNLVAAARTFGLDLMQYGGDELQGLPRSLGVWDGENLVFFQSDESYSWWSTLKILWKYGMSPIRTKNLMKKTVGKFLKLYDDEFPFESLSDVTRKVGLDQVTGAYGDDFLEQNGVSADFAKNIVQASTRVNYAQNLQQIHGLETMVCMATDGAMSVKGGNWQIFDGMIKTSDAGLALNMTVEMLSKKDGMYNIEALSRSSAIGSSGYSDDYDAVIMAAPVDQSNITFSPALVNMPKPVRYVNLHVTLFTSPFRLNPSAFNLPVGSDVPSMLLTTTSTDKSNDGKILPFFSISTLRSVVNHEKSPPQSEYLYKIFSPAPYSDQDIRGLLDVDPHLSMDNKEIITWKYLKLWQSYPYLPPRTEFDELQLHGKDGMLWYTSGIESFISTMETSSLMGMNVAKLISQRWQEEANNNITGTSEPISEL